MMTSCTRTSALEHGPGARRVSASFHLAPIAGQVAEHDELQPKIAADAPRPARHAFFRIAAGPFEIGRSSCRRGSGRSSSRGARQRDWESTEMSPFRGSTITWLPCLRARPLTVMTLATRSASCSASDHSERGALNVFPSSTHRGPASGPFSPCSSYPGGERGRIAPHVPSHRGYRSIFSDR